jgi:hypothetical protein
MRNGGIQVLLIVIVLLSSVFLYYETKNKTDAINNKISALENKIENLSTNLTTEVAVLNTKLNERAADSDKADKQRGLLKDLGKYFKINQIQTREDILAEMKSSINISDGQMEQIKLVLDDFQEEKNRIFIEKKERENAGIKNLHHLDELSAAGKKANARLKEVMDSEQYKLMLEYEFDQLLGIRIPAATKKTEGLTPLLN